jgi:hypothetical protein
MTFSAVSNLNPDFLKRHTRAAQTFGKIFPNFSTLKSVKIIWQIADHWAAIVSFTNKTKCSRPIGSETKNNRTHY